MRTQSLDPRNPSFKEWRDRMVDEHMPNIHDYLPTRKRSNSQKPSSSKKYNSPVRDLVTGAIIYGAKKYTSHMMHRNRYADGAPSGGHWWL